VKIPVRVLVPLWEFNHCSQNPMVAPSDRLAARLARDGDPEPIDLQETQSYFTIGWKGHYRIEGGAFVYTDRKSGRVTAILGYPTAKIAGPG
jgi:hypothetical protein